MSTRGGMHYSRLGHVDYFKHTTHTARCATFISRSAALKYRFLLRPLNAVWGASSFNPAMAVSFSTIKAARLPAGRTSAYLQKNHGVDPHYLVWVWVCFTPVAFFHAAHVCGSRSSTFSFLAYSTLLSSL